MKSSISEIATRTTRAKGFRQWPMGGLFYKVNHNEWRISKPLDALYLQDPHQSKTKLRCPIPGVVRVRHDDQDYKPDWLFQCCEVRQKKYNSKITVFIAGFWFDIKHGPEIPFAGHLLSDFGQVIEGEWVDEYLGDYWTPYWYCNENDQVYQSVKVYGSDTKPFCASYSHYNFERKLQSILAGNFDKSAAHLMNHQICDDGACGFKGETTFVQCDSCGVWQHTACAGISSYEELHPEMHLCDRCSDNTISMVGTRRIQATTADELPLYRRSVCWGISNFIGHHRSRPYAWALKNFTVLELSLVFEDCLFSQHWRTNSDLPPDSYTEALHVFPQTFGQILQDLRKQIESTARGQHSAAELPNQRRCLQTLGLSNLSCQPLGTNEEHSETETQVGKNHNKRWTAEETKRLKNTIIEIGTGAPLPQFPRSDAAVAKKLYQHRVVRGCVSCKAKYLVNEKHECLRRCPDCTETYRTYKELRAHRRTHLEREYTVLKERSERLRPEECQQLIDLAEEEPRKPWKDVKRRMDEVFDLPLSTTTLRKVYGRLKTDPQFR